MVSVVGVVGVVRLVGGVVGLVGMVTAPVSWLVAGSDWGAEEEARPCWTGWVGVGVRGGVDCVGGCVPGTPTIQ
jgi:hypothetical protein